MSHNNVERIAVCRHSADIEQVARRAHAVGWRNPYGAVVYHREREWRVHQSHVYATLVGRVGHDILVACASQERASGQIAHHSVVLHLAQSHHVGQLPPVLAVATRKHSLSNVVELAPVACACPAVRAVGQELGIIFQGVLIAVEQILAIKLDKCKKGRKEQQ